VDPAALDRRTGHDRLDRLAKAEVGIGDDQLHPSQPAGPQAAEKLGPERAVLAVADGEAEDLTAAVPAHPGGHDHGLGDDAAVDPGLAVGRINEHIGERLAGQGAVPERRDLLVQVGTDPGDLALGDAAVSTQRPHQIVDLASGDAVQIRLHDHREQRLIDPAAPLQQRGKERPGPQLGNAQLQIPGRCRQHPGPVAVALGQPIGRPLMRGGADHSRELGLDEGLIDGLGGLANTVVDLGDRECVQDLQQCRLVKGHRALCPFARTIGVVSLTITRWPLCCTQLRHRGSATYTTRWDATLAPGPHWRSSAGSAATPGRTSATTCGRRARSLPAS
jgi:hypothetical protein